ncbi:MAG: UvrD-helicase domain-containing protein [Deltaproteobacteria bacterium]|nr:UvrD-helicase domain-containing protein [Deltaproteobacteria bacterium]
MQLDLSNLNPEQHSAVTTTEGPVLVLAGAGSGKTRVITTRAAYIIAAGLAKADQVLALTFTNKAAGEMAQRAAALTQAKTRPLTATFHAFGVRMLRAHIQKLGFHPDFVIYDEHDQQAVVKDLADHHPLDPFFTPQTAHYAIQSAKSRGLKPEDLLRNESPADRTLGEIYRRYQETLKGMNAVDFEDILWLPLELAERFPEETKLYFARWRYVMVDEYQDTNTVQYKLLGHLAAGHRNLCVVGDDDQSIYGWRGARPENMAQFLTDRPEAKVIRLERNYRSTETILTAANQVIAHNPGRQPKTLRGLGKQGDPLVWIEGEEERDELEQVAAHLRITRMKTGAPLNDFGLLFRSNHQSRLLEEVLREEGIPYRLVGVTSFYERKEVKDALAYLRLLHNPADEVSLFRVINFPRRNIGKTSQVKLMEYARHQRRPVMDILRVADQYPEFTGPQAQSMVHLAQLLDRFRLRFQSEPLGEVFRAFLADLKFHAAVELEKKEPKARAQALGLVAELESATDHFARNNPQAALRDYLERIALYTRADQGEDPRDQVTLLTVHSAKGLEFPFVYLVGMADDQFPHKRALEENGVEEERRLAYVAFTRAMKQLVFSMAKVRRRYGETVRQQPSRFLLDIPAHLFQGAAPHGEGAAQLSKEQLETRKQEAKSRFFEQMRRLQPPS